MATTENIIGTGVTGTGPHSFTFPYIKADDVKVTKTIANGTETTLTKVASSPGSTQYTQAATSITLGAALIDTDKLRIYRDTGTTGLIATFYPGSAIRSADLNDNFTQNLYSTQETTNNADSAVTIAETALTNSQNTATPPVSAISIAEDALANSRNTAAPPVSAISIAETADSNATTALTNSRTLTTGGTIPAPGTYTTAIYLADQADATATTANNTAAAAETKSDTAKLATDNLVATNSGTTAAPVWVLQGDGTNSTTNNKGVKYAVTEAEAAVATANAAEAAVADAGIYITKANYAALPTITSSNTGDFYQITDSTNIDIVGGVISESGISDPDNHSPDTFTGGDEFTVKFKANNSTGKWEWQAYFANDPESRYRNNVIIENQSTISQNYTISQNSVAISYGPVAIASGYTVTIPSTSSYRVI